MSNTEMLVGNSYFKLETEIGFKTDLFDIYC